MHKSWLAIAALAAMSVSAFAETPVERGGYLVNTIMTCNNCHTPNGPQGPDFSRALSGGSQVFDTPDFVVRGANITPDVHFGIGNWSANDIKKTLVTGVRPNGVPLATIMPTGFYGVITAHDLDAIAAYLKSVTPVANGVDGPNYKQSFTRAIFPGAEKQMTEADFSDKLRKGFYLATIGHCMECHTPQVNGRGDFANRTGAGGQEFKGPWGVSVSRNITSDKEKGIGAWTDAEVKRAITQGIAKDGSKLKPPMGFRYYAKMTDEDLDSVIAWLRTLPPKS